MEMQSVKAVPVLGDTTQERLTLKFVQVPGKVQVGTYRSLEAQTYDVVSAAFRLVPDHRNQRPESTRGEPNPSPSRANSDDGVKALIGRSDPIFERQCSLIITNNEHRENQ
ncbi:hypothetical protein FRC11_010936, partial [Ceratobasidium sp. 423]